MVGEKIIAIFDAKNYDKDSSQKNDVANKMLAYLTNLDANFGALCFPEYDYVKLIYPRKNDFPKYHFDLKLVHYKMQPKDSEDAIITTKKMILDLLNEISNKI